MYVRPISQANELTEKFLVGNLNPRIAEIVPFDLLTFQSLLSLAEKS